MMGCDTIKPNIFNPIKNTTDNRTPVPKPVLDAWKLDAFDQIQDRVLEYYETTETVEGPEYDFHAAGFGEAVEDIVIDFHQLRPVGDPTTKPEIKI